VQKFVKFRPQEKGDFLNILNQRVNLYFKEAKKSKNADWRMVLKTTIMFLVFFVPYGFIVTGAIESGWMVVLLYSIMGVGTAGIGLGVMHDAVHGAYFKSQKFNKMMGLSMYMIGGSAINWRIQHNVLHHTYTNIDSMDDDITPKFILRFSPHTELRSYHKYQHIYAWFLYTLTTLLWVVSKDIVQLRSFKERGLLEKQGVSYIRAMLFVVFSKIVYISYTLVLPLFLTSVGWGFVVIGFIIMHLVAGISLGLIFQPAHLTEKVTFPLPNENNMIEQSWAEHQLYTSSNFANENKFITWFAGGLNYQIEHHLYPTVCHVHYKAISKIVRKTAAEFKLPYIANETFFGALKSHSRTLQHLGTHAA